MTNRELIKQKKAQIKALEEEIKSLRGPKGISSVMKNNFAFADHDLIYYAHEWSLLRKLVLRAFGAKYVTDLSEDQIFFAAEMADEILTVWNKYYTKISLSKIVEERK